MEKIKILLAAGTFSLGGTEKHFYQLCTHLDRDDFEIYLALTRPVKNDIGPIPCYVNCLFLEGHYLSMAHQVYLFIVKNRINVVYSCAFETSVPILLVWPLIAFKVSFYTGIRGFFNFPLRRRALEYVIIAFSKQIICNSVKAKKFVPTLFRNKCNVIYNGIAPLSQKMNKLTARAELGLCQKKKIFVCVARLCADKGQDVLVEAYAKAFLDDNQVQLVLIGDGEDKANLTRQITALNMGKSIILLGSLPSAAQYLPAFDIFVLPSRTESFPNALLEAMQYGLPCVATNVGGVEEIYDRVNFGKLVKKEDTDGLARAMKEILYFESRSYNLNDFSLRTNIESFSKIFLENNR